MNSAVQRAQVESRAVHLTNVFRTQPGLDGTRAPRHAKLEQHHQPVLSFVHLVSDLHRMRGNLQVAVHLGEEQPKTEPSDGFFPHHPESASRGLCCC